MNNTRLLGELGASGMRMAFNFLREGGLGHDRFSSEEVPFGGQDALVPLRAIRERMIAEKIAEAKRLGQTFDNNATFGLRRVLVSRPDERGHRANCYHLVMEPMRYYDFYWPNLCLDRVVEDPRDGASRHLAEIIGLDQASLGVADLPRYPHIRFKVGVSIALLTSDGYVVVSVRSRSQLVAGKGDDGELVANVSVGEGMHGSDVLPGAPGARGAFISPFATASRGLLDELNIDGSDMPMADIRCLAMLIDTERAQPEFVMIAPTRLDVEAVFDRHMDGARDAHENEAIFAVPAEARTLAMLLGGATLGGMGYRYPESDAARLASMEGHRIRMASSHAIAGFALLAKHLGFEDELLERLGRL